jgi:hypothetical protein
LGGIGARPCEVKSGSPVLVKGIHLHSASSAKRVVIEGPASVLHKASIGTTMGAPCPGSPATGLRRWGGCLASETWESNEPNPTHFAIQQSARFPVPRIGVPTDRSSSAGWPGDLSLSQGWVLNLYLPLSSKRLTNVVIMTKATPHHYGAESPNTRVVEAKR